MSHDPLSMSDQATFALSPGDTPEHRDLGYCNCHPAEKGHDADCGLPQHRAEHRRRAQAQGQEPAVKAMTLRELDAARAELNKLRDTQHDTSAGRKPHDTEHAAHTETAADLREKFRAVIPADVQEHATDPFVTGYRQGFLVAAQAIGVNIGGHEPLIIGFEPGLDADEVQRVRQELIRRVQQLREAYGW